MNNLLNFFNKKQSSDGAATENENSGEEQSTNTSKGFLKIKLLLPIFSGGGGFLFLMIAAACLVILPLAAIDNAMNGIQKTLEDAGESAGAFFESLGNFFATGYWGTGEEVFYRVVGDRYEYYLSKNIDVDAPLVLSAVFIGNSTMMQTNSECTIVEPDTSEEQSSDEIPEIEYDCGDEQTEQSYNDLRNEAITLMEGMVEGNSVKSEEEYRKWLYDNFIEDKLRAMGTTIPSDEESKETMFNDLIDQIYFNRNMYEAALNDFTEADTGGGTCRFNIVTSEGTSLVASNVKVRLLECDVSSGLIPLEDEELVDLEKYILGVTYQENGGAPDEAVKAQAIVARSFTLMRGKIMGEVGKGEEENGSYVIPLRACTNDQAYCNPDEGCWSDVAGGESGTTIHSGYDASKTWSRPALEENNRIRALVAETAGQVALDKDGNVLYTSYDQKTQDQFQKLANEGKSAAEIIRKVFPDAVEISANCNSGNGSIHGDPDFTNVAAWKSPLNPYAVHKLFGQCTWFAWGRFYEIYGYSPGFTGDGYMCASQLVNAHPDQFVLEKTPVVGAIGSSDRAHNHVFVVTGVDGNQITIQEGNLDGKTNSFDDATTDWQTKTLTLTQLRLIYGDVSFANPKVLPN